ncbi:MAG: GGDEF domain-containing protein, partial [Clostridiales bacterium]|nr:GGDEF domain-containing protein [Clostridiales bacterium]
RDEWRTDIFARSFYSVDNRLVEDMYAKEDLTSALKVVESYLAYIGDFDSFHLCLNREWGEGGVGQMRVDYTDKMYEIMTCLNGGKKNEISFNKPFARSDILPVLHDTCDKPRAFLFTPIHFNSACFGFAAISFGDRIVGMEVSYMFWLRYIMLGIESLRRQTVFVNTKHTIEEIRFNDPLTGLNNYDGLVENTLKIVSGKSDGLAVTVLAVDIVGIGSINEDQGRKNGDKIIKDFSKIVSSCTDSSCICGRLGNDEFVIIKPGEEHSEEYIEKTVGKLNRSLDLYNEMHETKIEYTFGYTTEKVRNTDDIERLINDAVSEKNGNKMNERTLHLNEELSDEEIIMMHRVKDLLDNNKFEYHFQPIVDTKNGSIFAYEALMRPVTEPFIAPQVVIEYATKLGRLDEVEKYTFLNILSLVKNDMKKFEGKKVFINSIPGINVSESDRITITNMLTALSDTVVIELTERSELDDDALNSLKERYSGLGIQSAVDDYGTGYSNIVNLLRYMPDYVKIDRMLLAGIEDNPQKQHFVKDIVKFAHENDFKVLSEGVETSAELETCILLGTDLIQGFYTARPSKEIISELPASIREEIFRYSAKAHSDKNMME